MTPVEIKSLYKNHTLINEIAIKLNENNLSRIHLKGLSGSSSALIIASIFEKLNELTVLVLNDREEAAYFFDDLSILFSVPSEKVLFFPASFKRSLKFGKVEQENIVQRTEVLKAVAENRKCLIITYPDALIEKVITSETLNKNTLQIKVGEDLSLDFIHEMLHEYGFERVDFVFEPGQYSVRGGLIDIFSFSHDEPFRIDFFGDTIDSIRNFDIESQLSKEIYDEIAIVPNIQDGLEDAERTLFFNALTQNNLVAFRDIALTLDQVNITINEAISAESNEEEKEFDPNKFANSTELQESIKQVNLIEFGVRKNLPSAQVFQFLTAPQPQFNKNFDLLANDLKINTANGFSNYILSNSEKQIERLQAIFDDRDFDIDFTPLHFTLHEGFIDKDLQLAFYTDHQIFERYHRYRLQTNRSAQQAISLKELNKLHPGDYVVHIDHGIGKFAGLVKTDVNGKTQEAIRLVYRDSDSLLVSIHSLHRISKYKGKDGSEPKINKLGTAAWNKMKNKAKSKVKDIAKELIALYSERLKEKGFAFSHDTYLQQELEASFIYEDTPDQYTATQAVKEDMERQMPMDRLVCGDVGFGKTEVAIRAAFKAVADNKQVAILVPTTILAFQHYKTFTERLKDFPAKVGYVSRLRKASSTKQTLKELEEGKVDIIIGTHRLVGKDVKFKDLGLLIIDEEQKFGVSVKEKLKKLKINVDTLTLTATPIPRTLQFSLMGARDLSVIQTPPPNRFPIVTEVHGFNEAIIREAINYELDRNGQIFFIHNRVQNIYEVEEMVKRACPGVRTVVGHGQMDGQKLEKVLLDFINGDFDVLIATTIIESGLDIPNANTIIINHAQNFGLSELHQLRGRVGRSNKKAFCYLLAPPMSSLSPEARRRLKAIEEFSELGSGFNISMQDLDIRGAGNMLGAEQSGFIADIGYETYHRILNEAVQELKTDEFKEVFEQQLQDEASKAFLQLKFVNDCNIDTDMELRFPEGYINSISERMSLYRELDNLEAEEDLQQFELNLKDRFGAIPEEVNDLLNIVRLRWLAIDLGMERIILKSKKMICHFISDQQSDYYKSPAFTTILTWVQNNPRKCKMKEAKDKLSMVFENITDVNKAMKAVNEIHEGLPKKVELK